MMQHSARGSIGWMGGVLLALLLIGVMAPSGVSAAQPVGEEDEQHVQRATTIDSEEAMALAERFRPIVMVREQSEPCDDTGEPYRPVTVDLVLGQQDVELRENAEGSQSNDPVLTTDPEPLDLHAAGSDTYIDMPGNPRSPGCSYERWFKANMEGHEPAVYARVAEADNGDVVIQYHLYYVFNDFNNTHESDWEMVQLLFDGPTVADALEQEPVQVAYAQHGGGETAEWDSDKLEREGDRIVVYASAGSHASQYGSETYLGWGANGTGFGCDNTLAPVERLDPTPVLMTSTPNDPDDAQVWLGWEGRWGERQPWEYNGPLGPATSERWADPVGWQAGLRDSSIVVPGTSEFGPGPTDVFCTATEFGSRLLTSWAVEPWRVSATVVTLIAVVVGGLLFARKTIGEAFRIYRQHIPVFAVIGVLLIPIGMVANFLQWLITTYPPGREIVEVMHFSPASDFAAALSIGSLQQLVSLLVVVPSVLTVYRDIERGQPVTLMGTLAGIRQRFSLMIRALLKPLGIVFLLAISLVGIPWAVDRSVRWTFIPHAVILDDAPIDTADDRSAAAVRGSWWRTFGTLTILSIIGSMPGPVIGIVLMVTMGAQVQFVNALSSLIYAGVLPFSILGSVVLYRRRQGRSMPPEAVPVRSHEAVGDAHMNPGSA